LTLDRAKGKLYASVQVPFPEHNNNGLGMDLNRSGTPRERAAHYRQRAANLLQMAEAELVESIRIVLRETAAQYHKLADYLNRPGKSDADWPVQRAPSGTFMFCGRCIAAMQPARISSERYQQEVERIQRLAETFRSEQLRRKLLDVARQYGELAKRAHPDRPLISRIGLRTLTTFDIIGKLTG
jgi:hypothetical protein